MGARYHDVRTTGGESGAEGCGLELQADPAGELVDQHPFRDGRVVEEAQREALSQIAGKAGPDAPKWVASFNITGRSRDLKKSKKKNAAKAKKSP